MNAQLFAAALGAALLVGGCASRTEVVAIITSYDLIPGVDIDSLYIQVTDPGLAPSVESIRFAHPVRCRRRPKLELSVNNAEKQSWVSAG